MKIGVLCSGGDAPGMNPCLRAIVRAAGVRKDQIIGIRHGYAGLMKEDFYKGGGISHELAVRMVSGLASRGGTILNSSRCPEFATPEGRQQAADVLRKN